MVRSKMVGFLAEHIDEFFLYAMELTATEVAANLPHYTARMRMNIVIHICMEIANQQAGDIYQRVFAFRDKIDRMLYPVNDS